MLSTTSSNNTEPSSPASPQKRVTHVVSLALIMTLGFHLICYRGYCQYFTPSIETSGRALAVGRKQSSQELTTDDPHFSKVALLGLLPWERETMNATFEEAATRLTKDQLPQVNRDFMKSHCTLGTVFKGLHMAQSPACRHRSSSGGYDRVEQAAQELLESTSSDDCDICHIVEHFHRNHESLHTLTFWGDSVQKQVFFGFLCELGRRNYHLNMTNTTNTKIVDNWSLRQIYTVTITSPTWTTTTTALDGINNSNHQGVTLKFFFQYKPIRPMAALYNETIQHMLEAKTSVLVYNFGLHWKIPRRDVYQKHLEHVLDTLAHYGGTNNNMSLILFRETSAQHFLSAGGIGDYEDNLATTSNMTCGPHTHNPTENPLYGWRNQDALQTLREHTSVQEPVVVVHPNESASAFTLLPNHNNRPAVGILPFQDFSAARHDLHPEECTHFCHTPFLWMPLWRSLRLAMDATFGDLE